MKEELRGYASHGAEGVTGRTPPIPNTRPADGTQGRLFPPEVTRNADETSAKLN